VLLRAKADQRSDRRVEAVGSSLNAQIGKLTTLVAASCAVFIKRGLFSHLVSLYLAAN
jgi:hypothetical protein